MGGGGKARFQRENQYQYDFEFHAGGGEKSTLSKERAGGKGKGHLKEGISIFFGKENPAVPGSRLIEECFRIREKELPAKGDPSKRQTGAGTRNDD